MMNEYYRANNGIRCSSLIHFEIVYILFIKFFIDTLGIPSAAWYLCDAINIVLIISYFRNKRWILGDINAKYLQILLWVIFAFSIIGYFINMKESFLLYLWGFRNLGRMFAFWLICVAFLNRNDLIKILHTMYVAYIINFVLSIFQFTRGIQGDNLGGIFGIKAASNSYSINLCMIVVTLSICAYLRKEVSLVKAGIIILMAMVLAPLAELKALYFFFGGMILMALVMESKISLRVGVIIAGSVIGLYAAIRIMSIVSPESLSYMTIDGALSYLGDSKGYGYSTVNDLSRMGAISKLYELFFKNDPIKNIFGFGLGSCETSNFGFLNSAFYQKYEYLHYRWFFDAMLYLEMGVGGLILFSLFGIFILMYIRIHKREFWIEDRSLIMLTNIFVIYSFVLAVYNGSLRIEAGYFNYLIFAIPFILMKQQDEEEVYPCANIFQITKYRFTIGNENSNSNFDNEKQINV